MQVLSTRVIGSLIAGLSAMPVAAQPRQTPTFRSSASLVAVTAAVRTAKGAAVTTLTQDDFEILDNGQARPIKTFYNESAPGSIVILFDRSGSMRVGNKTAAAREVTRQLLSWLEAGADEVSLLGFDKDVSRLEPFTPAPGHILEDLEHVDSFGSTSLHDAVAIAADQVAERKTRRAVVVLTDGMDTSSRMSAGAVAKFASVIDVPIYVLVSKIGVERAGGDGVNPDLTELAERTGGQLFVVTTPAETSQATRTIASDLHHQYLLAFESDGKPGWHALQVRVKPSKLIVRARTGYDAGIAH